MRVSSLLLIVLAVGSASVSAQTLADVARQENQRRQTVKASGKTYTNQDLKPVPAVPDVAAAAPGSGSAAGSASSAASGAPADTGSPDSVSAADSTAPTAAPDTADSNSAAEPEAKGESYWSQRMADLRERLERDQVYADALQNRIDALTIDFVNRDDPAQQAQIGADRQRALAELDRVKKSIEQDKRAIPALEEEARRAGVPPGWLR
jgi:hypothetical protein